MNIFRDVRVLFLVTLAPTFLLLMLSYVFSMDNQHSKVVVIDWDRSTMSRDYISQITADGDFVLQGEISDYASAEAVLLAGNADLAVIIPHGFGDDARTGHATQLQVLVDGMNPLTARKAIAQLTARTSAYAASRLGQTSALITIAHSVDVYSRAWFNPAIKTLYSMVPTLLAVVLFMPAMAFTLALAREKETGSFEGLMATPVSGLEYLAGKLLAYVLTGMVGAMVATLVAVTWFQVPFRGDFATFLEMTALYYFATMSAGILIANFVTSQQTAMTIFLLVFFLPSFFIAGLMNPIDTTSLSSQLPSMPIPQTYFIVIARAIFLKKLGWYELWKEALALSMIGGAMFIAGILLFKKKVN